MASSTAELDLSPLSDGDSFSFISKRTLDREQRVRSVSQRSLNLKSSNVPRHFSMQSISSVQEAEKTLTQLVVDFEKGKLHAFGNAAVLDRMQEIRTMQEALTQKHLAMDSDLLQKAAKGDMKQDGEFVSDLTDLMSELKDLTQAIQKLETPLATTSVEEKPRHKFQDIKIPHVFVQEVFEDASGEPVGSHAQEQSSLVCSTRMGEDEKPSTLPQEHSSHSPTVSVLKFAYPQQQSKDEAPRKSLSPSRSLVTEV